MPRIEAALRELSLLTVFVCLILFPAALLAETDLSTISGRMVERLPRQFTGTLHIEVLRVNESGSVIAESQTLRMGRVKGGILPSDAPRWRTDSVSWHFHVNMPTWMEPVYNEALLSFTDFGLDGPSLILEPDRVNLGLDLLDGTNMVFVDEDEEILDEFLGAGIIASVFRHNHNQTGETLGSEMLLAKGAPQWLDDELRRLYLFAEELFAHEIGHTMGLPHSCGGIETPPCVDGTIEDQATMRASLNFDMRGTMLMEWDLLAMTELYGMIGMCEANTTTLCLPDESLDEPRFAVTVDVDTDVGPGFEGPGTALSLDSLGVRRGGLFWFFNPTNPELLVKILNGCNATGHWWVFLSAGTNVRFDVTIIDSRDGAVVWTHSNPDGNAAEPVTATRAFVCE